MGADGTEAAVEAMAGGSHGFPVELSLSLSLSLIFYLFWSGSHDSHALCFFCLIESPLRDTNQNKTVTREPGYFFVTL